MEAKAHKLFTVFKELASSKPSFNQTFYQHLTLTTVQSNELNFSKLTFTLPILDHYCDIFGNFTPGAASSILDAVTNFSVWTSDPLSRKTLSINLSLNFASPARPGETLTLISECLDLKERYAYCSGRATVGSRLIAVANQSVYLTDKRFSIA